MFGGKSGQERVGAVGEEKGRSVRDLLGREGVSVMLAAFGRLIRNECELTVA